MKKIEKLNTKLIIIICVLIVIVVILIILIIKNNNIQDESQNTEDIVTENISQIPTDIPDNGDINGPTKTENLDDVTPTIAQPEEQIIVTLGEYKGIEVDYSPVIITDSDIDHELDVLKSQYTEIVDMPERPFEVGDMAVVTYRGSVDGTVIDEMHVICLQIILGQGSMPEFFENEIIGRKQGDKFTLDMDYPEDYTAVPEAAGKKVHFDVELVDGFIFEVPEINDEFISRVTEYSNVEEFRSMTMTELQREQNDIAYENAIYELKSKVIENADFSGPIDDKIKVQYVLRLNAENQKCQEEYLMDAATYYEIYYGLTAKEFTEFLMEEVAFEVKYEYVLDEVVKQENLAKTNPDASQTHLRELAEEVILKSAVIDGLEL